MNEDKLTSEDWYPIVFPKQEVIIMDPDGWDRSNWKFSWYQELITRTEFNNRVLNSTCLRTLQK